MKSKKQYPLIRLLDIPLILGALLFCIFLFIQATTAASGKILVEIKTEKQRWLFAIEENRSFEAPGPLGVTEIEIKESTVFVTSSPCTEKLCVHAGAIKKAGQWIACLPNKVFITLKGQNNGKVDAYSF